MGKRNKEEIECIAQAVAQELLKQIYNQVGRTAVKQFMWLVASVILAVGFYLGIIKLPGH
jgi:hypothetical protein